MLILFLPSLLLAQACLNKLTNALHKLRVAPSARASVLGSLFEMFELKMDVELALSYDEEFAHTLNIATKAVQVRLIILPDHFSLKKNSVQSVL